MQVVKAVVRTVVKVAVEIVSRVFNSIAQIVLYGKEKKIRIVVLILRDEKGVTLIQEIDQGLHNAIAYAKKTFKDRMNIQIAPYGNLIQTLPDSAPFSALGVDCDSTEKGDVISITGTIVGGIVGVILGGPMGMGIGIALGFGIGSVISGKNNGGALYNEFSEAGEYFAKNTAGWGWLRMNFYFPITIFIVREISGKVGCSLGPLTDYVTLSIDGVKDVSTLAHELGHCCGLRHRDDKIDNLMYSSNARTNNNITGMQKYSVRTSRHCTFW